MVKDASRFPECGLRLLCCIAGVYVVLLKTFVKGPWSRIVQCYRFPTQICFCCILLLRVLICIAWEV